MARPLAWGDTVFSTLMVSATPINAVDLLAQLADSDTVTAMRIVGHLYVAPDPVTTQVDGAYQVDVGIGVTSIEAFAANVVPDPNNPSEVPARGWLWVDRMYCSKRIVIDTGMLETVGEVRFDIRSARKVDRGVLYLNAFQSNVSGTANNLRLVGRIRVLCAT